MAQCPASAPHTAPVITKIHFPFDAPKSPRSVRTTEKAEPQFTFDNSSRAAAEAACGVITLDGSSVYYNRHHRKSESTIGSGRLRNYYADASELNGGAAEKSGRQPYDDQGYFDESHSSGRQSKYSRKETPSWKNRFEHVPPAKSKPNQPDYVRKKSAPRFDDTMFPFDREALDFEPNGSPGDWYKGRFLSNYGSNHYDTPSPDYDCYESFCDAARTGARKSNVSATSDVRLFKELTRLSNRQLDEQQQQQRMKPLPSKMSKYDESTPKMSCMNMTSTSSHHSQNNISAPDAFCPLPANTSDTTTTTITTIVTSNVVPSADDSKTVFSKFEQIASMFDQIPPKSSDAFRACAAPAAADASAQYINCNSVTPSQPQQPAQSPSKHAGGDPLTPFGTIPSPVPDLRVDFFTETSNGEGHFGQKRHSYVDCIRPELSGSSEASIAGMGINVTPNPMDETAGCASQAPRATIVVQQVI